MIFWRIFLRIRSGVGDGSGEEEEFAGE